MTTMYKVQSKSNEGSRWYDEGVYGNYEEAASVCRYEQEVYHGLNHRIVVEHEPTVLTVFPALGDQGDSNE